MVSDGSLIGYLLSPFILLVPFAALAWVKRDWVVFALLALLPTYLWRTSVAGIPTTWFELALYLVALIFLVRGDLKWLRGRGVEQARTWLPPVALWLAAAMIGVLAAPHTRLALGIFKGWIIDPLLCVTLLWVVYQKISTPLQFFKRTIGALLVGATITSVWAMGTGLSSGLQRFGAWYDSPNVLAMYLVPVAVVTILWLAMPGPDSRPGKIERWFWYSATVVLLGTIATTGSYGAWLALVLGLAVGSCYRRPQTRRLARWFGWGIFIVGLLLPWVVVGTGQWPFVSHQNASYNVSSGQVRFVLWREATQVISRRPLVGVGLGEWQGIFDAQIRPYLPEVRNPGYSIELHYASLFPHNLWLTVWLSLGVLGLVALAWLTGLIYRTRASANYLLALPAALFTTILAQGWFDTPVFKNDLAILFWLPVVLSAVAYTLPQIENS